MNDKKEPIPGYDAEPPVYDHRKLSDDSLKPLSAEAQAIDEKKLMRKIDLKLIPWLSLLYLISFLDVWAIESHCTDHTTDPSSARTSAMLGCMAWKKPSGLVGIKRSMYSSRLGVELD